MCRSCDILHLIQSGKFEMNNIHYLKHKTQELMWLRACTNGACHLFMSPSPIRMTSVIQVREILIGLRPWFPKKWLFDLGTSFHYNALTTVASTSIVLNHPVICNASFETSWGVLHWMIFIYSSFEYFNGELFFLECLLRYHNMQYIIEK